MALRANRVHACLAADHATVTSINQPPKASKGRLEQLAQPLPDQSSDRPYRGQPRAAATRRPVPVGSGGGPPSSAGSARSGGGDGAGRQQRSPIGTGRGATAGPGLRNGALKNLIPGIDKLDAKVEANEVALAKNEYLDWLRKNPPKPAGR